MRRGNGARLAAGAVVVVAAVVLFIAVAEPFGSAGASSATVVPTGTAPIVRTNVVERQQVAGTLDYRGNYTVWNEGTSGILTWLPAAGATISRGQKLYALDRIPVRLLYGNQPASRDLKSGETGADVRELQRNLLALGFSDGGALHVDGVFDTVTHLAVEQWQRVLGARATGALPLGTVVFLPGRIRAASLTATTGQPVTPGSQILTATSSKPAVLVPLDPGTVSRLAVRDPVLVTMPDGSTVDGRVASIGRVATAAPDNTQSGGGGISPPTVPVTVSLTTPRTHGGLDQAPVQVAITEQAAARVLAVPISALLARPGGGYAVDLVAANGTHLVPVTTGLFDDVAGRVQVSAPHLRPGMRVQVPRQ